MRGHWMFEQAGHLNKFWHVCAFSHEIKQTPLGIKIYNTPIVLWRDNKQKIYALLDSCPHRGSPLSAGHCHGNTISCPYHGWTFDHNGTCISVPCENPRFKFRKKVPTFEVKEDIGLVWIYLDHCTGAKQEPFSLASYQKNDWHFIYRKQLFKTNAALLIENFMDSSHTSFVHKGLIRGISQKTERKVEVKCEEHSVLVSHPATKEKVGIGSNLLIGKNAEVSHTDEFILPSIVKVDYKFKPKKRGFLAFIFCTPTSANETMAHVMIGLRFGVWSYLIKPILPALIRKILNQDEEITRLQHENKRLLGQGECDAPSDYMHRQVKILRERYLGQEKDQTDYQTSTKQFSVWF